MTFDRILRVAQLALLLLALLLAYNAFEISQGHPATFDLKTPLAQVWSYVGVVAVTWITARRQPNQPTA